VISHPIILQSQSQWGCLVFSGLMGGAGGFHRLVDEHQIERAIVQRGEAALAAIRDCAPEPALLEPDAYGKVCRSSSTTKMRRMSHLPCRVGRSMRLVGRPCQKGQPSTQSRGQFCLANQCTIAFPPQIAGLSALYSV
jgi:hypothetical protein